MLDGTFWITKIGEKGGCPFYAGEEISASPNGTWARMPGGRMVSPMYELNGLPVASDKIVVARFYPESGDWRFSHSGL